MPDSYPIHGSEDITYVHLTDPSNPDSEGTILYAGNDGRLESGHEFLFEAAKIEDIVDEDAEPLGGGHLDTETLAKTRDSHAFGGIEPRILEELEDKLREELR